MSVNWPTLDEFVDGSITFGRAGEIISDVFSGIFGHENFVNIWTFITDIVSRAGALVTLALLILALVETFFGRRLIKIERFIFFFGIGFASGASLVAPLLVSAGVAVVPWIVGLVVGALAAVLAKLLYVVLYVFFAGYATYMIFMGGQLLPETVTSFSKGNMIFGLVAAAIAIVFALLLRKWIEMLGTAVLGAYLATLSVDTLTGGLAEPLFIIVLTTLALLGFLVQAKIRRRRRR